MRERKVDEKTLAPFDAAMLELFTAAARHFGMKGRIEVVVNRRGSRRRLNEKV